MFKPKESDQIKYEFVSIDELVPADHLLRVIDKFIDFSFLLERSVHITAKIRAAWGSLLPVTGIEECLRTGSSYCSLPKSKKDCNTLSQVGKGVLQFFR